MLQLGIVDLVSSVSSIVDEEDRCGTDVAGESISGGVVFTSDKAGVSGELGGETDVA